MTRLIGLIVVCTSVLVGCGKGQFTNTLDKILPDPTVYAYGAIVADEAAAVVAAQDAVARGGTAADAAVALYFTLSVTLPSVASLGGGGACLVHDPKAAKTEMLDFIAPAARAGPAAGDRPTAIPGNVRGMASLHARYGRLPWASLLSNAESLARGGMQLSRPMAGDLARAAGPLFADAASRRLFAAASGAPLVEGDPLRQVELGSTLGRIRARGAGAFYMGPLADRLVDAVRRSGGTLTKIELRRFVPRWRQALAVDFGSRQFYVAAPPAAAGPVAAQMWQMLVTDGRYTKAPAEERPHLLAEAGRRAFAERRLWIAANGRSTALSSTLLSPEHARDSLKDYDPSRATPTGVFAPRADGIIENASGSGFVVVDGSGMAVACAVTMYNLFGTGRVVPGIGIYMALAPGVGSRNPFSLGPVMVTESVGRVFRFAAAGAGGAVVPTSIVNVAARTLLDDVPLKDAMRGGRVHADAAEGAVLVEPGETAPRVETLVQRGHAIERRREFGRINAIDCPSGVPAVSERRIRCSTAADKRGAGLGVTVLFQKE